MLRRTYRARPALHAGRTESRTIRERAAVRSGEPERSAESLGRVVKTHEGRCARLSRMFKAACEINALIPGCVTEAGLFGTVCDAVLGLDGVSLVWVALRDADALVPRACAGRAALVGAPGAEGLGHEALRRDATVKGAILTAAAVALPLRREGRAVGVLCVGATTPNGFDAEAVLLLEALARGASQALDRFSRARALREAEGALSAVEAQLRQAQKTEAIGRLAGGVAHDFNNLLCIIGSYTDFALECVRPEDPMAAELHEIRKASTRAEALTRQLLAFSRKEVSQPRVVDLNAVVSSVERMLQRLIGEDIAMRFVPCCGVWPVRVDPCQVEQVIMNLVVNARDAMPEGGAITLATANLVDRGGGRSVALTVTDTGVGIDASIRPHIFEPFFTTKAPGQGTGLGLATVHNIVAGCGGSITVDAAPGGGTTFTIVLPAAPGAQVLDPTPAQRVERLRGSETVLLVEDEESVRALAQRVLTEAGYVVLTAASSEEATAHCAGAGSDVGLLLTDVVLPGRSGPALARHLQTIRPSLRVLFMSGYTHDAIARRCALDPGVQFISKPFSPRALREKVRAALDPRRSLSQS